MKIRFSLLTISLTVLLLFIWYIQFSFTPGIQPNAGFNSIAKIEKIEINGSFQYLIIRGKNYNAPLLLVLHGGPGTPLTPIMRKYNSALESDFVVVYWEQRGAGKSFTPFMDLSPFTVDRYVQDTNNITKYLLNKFQRNKLILLGHSWGSVIGLITAYRYPNLFSAYIGVGQNLDPVRQESMTYSFTVEKANEAKDFQALKTLKEIGLPNQGRYMSGKDSIFKQRRILSKYNGDSAMFNLEEAYTKAVIECKEYSWIEKALFTWGISSSLKSAEEDIQLYNLFVSVLKIEVPLFLISGRNDGNASPKLVKEYFNTVHAKKKQYIELANSAHYPMLDQPEDFHKILLQIAKKIEY